MSYFQLIFDWSTKKQNNSNFLAIKYKKLKIKQDNLTHKSIKHNKIWKFIIRNDINVTSTIIYKKSIKARYVTIQWNIIVRIWGMHKCNRKFQHGIGISIKFTYYKVNIIFKTIHIDHMINKAIHINQSLIKKICSNLPRCITAISHAGGAKFHQTGFGEKPCSTDAPKARSRGFWRASKTRKTPSRLVSPPMKSCSSSETIVQFWNNDFLKSDFF